MNLAVRIAAVIAAVALVASGWWAPVAPAHDDADSTFAVLPAPAPLSCPGPLTVPVGDIDPGDPDIAPTDPDAEFRLEPAAAVQALTGEGSWFEAVAAVQWQRTDTGDVASLAAMSCGVAQHEQWLVGGSTSIGSSARLVLSNPSRAAADVTVSVFGPVGRVDQTASVVVAPWGQTEVLIEAIDVGVAAVVVLVESTGSGVHAALQDSRLDGIQPAGTDWVTASTPGTEVVIPVIGHERAERSVVRLMSPEGTTATLTLVTEDGIQFWGGTSRIVLDPGVVVDIEAPLVGAGAVEIRADAPVVAASRTVVSRPATQGLEGDIARDHRWVAAHPVVAGTQQAVAVDGASMWLYSPSASPVTVTASDGQTWTVEAEPRTVSILELDVAPGTVVTTDRRVAWALVADQEPGFVTVIQPRMTDLHESHVTVAPGTYPAPRP